MELALSVPQNGSAFLWEPISGSLRQTFKDAGANLGSGHILPLTGFAAGVKEKPFVSLFAWGKEAAVLRCPVEDRISTLASFARGDYLLAGSVSGKLYAWELASGVLMSTRSIHYQQVTCLALGEPNDFAVSAGADGIINVWSLSSLFDQRSPAEPLFVFSEHVLGITSLAIGPGLQGSVLYSSSDDHSIKVHCLRSGRLLTTFEFGEGVSSMVLSASGRYIMAGLADGTVCRVSVAGVFPERVVVDAGKKAGDAGSGGSGQGGEGVTTAAEGHRGPVTCLALSFAESLMLSGGSDGAVRVWDVDSLHCLSTFARHEGTSLAWVGFVQPAAAAAAGAAAAASGLAVERAWRFLQKHQTESAIVHVDFARPLVSAAASVVAFAFPEPGSGSGSRPEHCGDACAPPTVTGQMEDQISWQIAASPSPNRSSD